MLPAMRLVAVSIVKNEADIIEAFVRHTAAWVDEHLIFDHDSTDGTREILGALKTEGLRLSLFTDGALANLQQSRSNHLSVLAAQAHGADWILPLDADEILVGPSRAHLETALAAIADGRPAMLPLLNYFLTDADDASVGNPVLRLRYCQATPSPTRKIIVPRTLALDPAIGAGKGNHALYRGDAALPAQSLPTEYHLAHLALRSPEHQMMRVVLAELQKLSRGRAHAGLDVHYRLGFQLLTEKPELFFSVARRPTTAGRLLPIDYRGGALTHTPPSTGWNRVARALLRYLEKLAVSHGELVDAAGAGWQEANERQAVIRELGAADLPAATAAGATDAFAGFTPLSGWQSAEGPVPEAFLPVFHWALAPASEFSVSAPAARHATLRAELLTYSDGQTVEILLNGERLLEFAFPRVNQKEMLAVPLALQAGDNRVVIRYSRHLATPQDPRPLAVLYLSLRITA